MEPSRRLPTALLAVTFAAAALLPAGTAAAEDDAVEPEGFPAWTWRQALALPERVREAAPHAPAVAASGATVAVAPAPWSDDGLLRAEATVYGLQDDRIRQVGHIMVTVPDAPTTGLGGGAVAVAVAADRVALGLSGHERGVGVVHIAGQEEQQVQAPSNAIGFGRSLGMWGGLMAVGSVGAVYVYVETTEGWSLFQTIQGDVGTDFGASIAFADGALAVGAPGAPGGGAVHVYHHSARAMALVSILEPPPSTHGFGWDVAIDGMDIIALSDGDTVEVHRYVHSTDGWILGDSWRVAAYGHAALSIHPDLVVATSVQGIHSLGAGGASRMDRVSDQLVVGPSFGQDVAYTTYVGSDGSGLGALLVTESDRIHLFTLGAPCDDCAPPCCDVEPEPSSDGVVLEPGVPWTFSPDPSVSITYAVAAPAVLEQSASFSERTPAGLPAVPGNEEAPDLTSYLVVHVARFEPLGDAAPEPRVRIEVETPVTAAVDPARLSLYFFDGTAWRDLANVPPGTTIAATTAEGDLLVHDAGRNGSTVWAVVDHTSAYAVGLRPVPVPEVPAVGSMDGPWLVVGVLLFLVGGVWATNAIIGGGRLRRQYRLSNRAAAPLRPSAR